MDTSSCVGPILFILLELFGIDGKITYLLLHSRMYQLMATTVPVNGHGH